MPRVTHDDHDRVFACPECDQAGDVYQRTGNGNAYAGDPEAPFACHACGATFEQPVDRQKKPNLGGDQAAKQGLGRLLADMSPEDAGLTPLGEGDAA